MWKFIKFCFALIFLLAAALTLFKSMGEIPDIKAVRGSELSQDVISEMVETGIIGEDEQIRYFYSEDLLSFIDYGNLFTETRVVSYEIDEDTGEKYIYSATYGEITDIRFVETEGVLDDSVIEIHIDNQHNFSLVVSKEEDRDKQFYEEMLELWKNNRDKRIGENDVLSPPIGNETTDSAP